VAHQESERHVVHQTEHDAERCPLCGATQQRSRSQELTTNAEMARDAAAEACLSAATLREELRTLAADAGERENPR
jgi:predicted  nucleic acid-binding Zn-ribbon protein